MKKLIFILFEKIQDYIWFIINFVCEKFYCMGAGSLLIISVFLVYTPLFLFCHMFLWPSVDDTVKLYREVKKEFFFLEMEILEKKEKKTVIFYIIKFYITVWRKNIK